MTNKEIKELLEIFKESGLAEMEVQRGENRLRLRRAPTEQEIVVPATTAVAASPVAAQAPAGSPVLHPPAPAPSAGKPSAPDANEVLVKSPIVGTFYDAPSPGAPPFVKVGDRVEVGQVLCIIESMKLMNEIEAEVAGTVSAKLVENARPVEYGEALFSIRR